MVVSLPAILEKSYKRKHLTETRSMNCWHGTVDTDGHKRLCSAEVKLLLLLLLHFIVKSENQSGYIHTYIHVSRKKGGNQ